MILLAIYLLLFVPWVYTTAHFRAMRKARPGYKRFMFGLFTGLFFLGFLAAPAAGLGMLGLLAVAGKHAFSELRYRHRRVQYERGNGPRPPLPRGAGAQR